MSKQVTTLTLQDGTERVYESYPAEDYEALAASHARLQAELERWMAVARDAQKDADRLSGLEKLTEEGDCPGIINDDNGHWAVTDDGMQNIPCGDEPADINTTFYVEAAKWKPTIREAIDDYLTAARASTQAEKGEG